MLMYGSVFNIPDDTVVFNLTGLNESYPRLNLLVPSGIGYYDGHDFDVAYMNYIFGNEPVFYQFFKIVMNLYIGNDVYIIVDNENWSENLAESLLKLIQQRYGYNGARIDSYEDYVALAKKKNNGKFDPGFGLANLDQDKDRYSVDDVSINPRMYDNDFIDRFQFQKSLSNPQMYTGN